MIPVKHIDPDDLALYAMHLLPSEEHVEMTENLHHSAEARRVLAEFQTDLALTALTSEMHAPPAAARLRLMKQVGREKKAVPEDLLPQQTPQAAYRDAVAEMPTRTMFDEEPKRSVAAKVLPWIGWAAAAAMTIEAGTLYQQREALKGTGVAQKAQVTKLSTDAERASLVLQTVKDPLALRVTLTTGEPAVPTGRVNYVANKGSLVLLASNLAPIPLEKTYELWLIPADGTAPIPAGTFQPDAKGSASLILPTLPKNVQAKAFGITIEDVGGSLSPTLPIVLKGAAS
jgi:anti-sigma-K factor RskA